ncbi:cytochrome P450 2U1-like [Glandiceps talaboti]
MASVDSVLQVDSVLLFVILILTFVTLVLFCRRPTNLPPGPYGLPIVGALFALDRKPYKTFTKWGKVHGEVISVRLGTELVVVLNSREAMKDALVKQSAKFSSRPSNSTTALLLNHKGISDSPSPVWQAIRKYSLRGLHEHGMGKSVSEELILDGCEFLIQRLSENLNKPTDIRHVCVNAVSTVICTMVFGRRFENDGRDFKRLLELNNALINDLLASNLLTFIPILWYFPLPIKHRIADKWNKIRDYIDTIMETHDKRVQQKSDGECIADYFLLKSKEYKETTSHQDLSLSFLEDPDQIAIICWGLLAAGTDTTSHTLLWSILYLTLYPDIQAKCIEDIENGIGFERPPTFADRSKLPYIEATTLEVQRIASLVPMGVPHMTSESVILRGYSIPANTMVMTNIWGVHMNETEFDNPELFNPGRFLDESRNVVNRGLIVPFSLGARDCPGSSLAKVELFLFLTKLLQRFEFTLPEGDIPLTEGTLGIVNMPPPFRVNVREHNKQ